MNEIAFKDIVVENRDLRCRVTLEWIGEGNSGDYNPEDPNDCPLLRFSVSRWYKAGESPKSHFTDYAHDWVFDGDECVQVSDASYCTQLDARAPLAKLAKAARIIMDHVEGHVASETRIKKLCEELSWFEIKADGSGKLGSKLNERANYTFTVTIGAWGDNPDDAWENAVASFIQDPGSTPDEVEVEETENE